MTQIKEVFAALPTLFNPAAAGGVNAIFQYVLEGEGGGGWYIIVKDGKCEVVEGFHEDPDVTLTMDTATYIALADSQLDGVQAYMSGKVKVTGDLMLAQKLQNMFPG